jgi:hypothetical protein
MVCSLGDVRIITPSAEKGLKPLSCLSEFDQKAPCLNSKLDERPFRGAAATALNLGDFDADDQLVIDQMIEPIVMSASGLLRTGTMMLRKAQLLPAATRSDCQPPQSPAVTTCERRPVSGRHR